MSGTASFHTPSLPADPRPRRFSPRRLLVAFESRLRAASLDRALAAGTDPSSSPALSHRASLLASDRWRERMAGLITRILAASRRSGPDWSVAIPPNRVEISAAQPLLLQIEGILLDQGPVYAQGVAMLRELLRDGGSPLYARCPRGTLELRLEAVIAALEGARVNDR